MRANWNDGRRVRWVRCQICTDGWSRRWLQLWQHCRRWYTNREATAKARMYFLEDLATVPERNHSPGENFKVILYECVHTSIKEQMMRPSPKRESAPPKYVTRLQPNVRASVGDEQLCNHRCIERTTAVLAGSGAGGQESSDSAFFTNRHQRMLQTCSHPCDARVHPRGNLQI